MVSALVGCPKRGPFTNSSAPNPTETYGQTPPQAGHASHRKPNSYAAPRPNADLRTREFLTEAEVGRLIASR
jgi:hypothetical protein